MGKRNSFLRLIKPSTAQGSTPTVSNVRRLKNEISAAAQQSIDNAFLLNNAILGSQKTLDSLDAQLREIRAAVMVGEPNHSSLLIFLKLPNSKGESRDRALLSTLNQYLLASKALLEKLNLKDNPQIGTRYKTEIDYAVTITNATCEALNAVFSGEHTNSLHSVLESYIPFSDNRSL